MSDKPKSRQVKWQEKMIAEGRCRQCGGAKESNSSRCNKCLKKVNIVVDKLQKA